MDRSYYGDQRDKEQEYFPTTKNDASCVHVAVHRADLESQAWTGMCAVCTATVVQGAGSGKYCSNYSFYLIYM